MIDPFVKKVVRNRLMKEGRLIELARIQWEGYAIVEPSNGKYKFELASKNPSKMISLTIDIDDPQLPYQSMLIMHRMGRFVFPNQSHYYQVNHYTYHVGGGEVVLISRHEDEHFFQEELKQNDPLVSAVINSCHMSSSGTFNYKFASEEDFYSFVRSPYRIIQNTVKSSDEYFIWLRRLSELQSMKNDIEEEMNIVRKRLEDEAT